ncbi:MAG: S49 family peptidase [Pseudomonadota bacterium]
MSRISAAAAARLAGRPLAFARDRLAALLAFHADEAWSGPRRDVASYAVVDGGIAIVPVLGPLVARNDWLSALFGAISYGDLVGAVAQAFADDAVRAVVLEVDSPGGEVAGLFDAVAALGVLKEGHGKPLHAIANEAALSAAYAIASAADRLIVTRTAETGSIGVVAVHVDESGADRQAGLAWTYVFAGERKIDGNEHQPLSDRARTAMQADVDRLHAELCSLVAANRGTTPEAIRSTDAAIYRGELAVAAGLADGVGTLDSVLSGLLADLDRSEPVTFIPAVQPTRRSLAMADQKTSKPKDPGQTDPVPTTPAQNDPPAPSPDTPPTQTPAPALPPGSPAPPPLPPAHDPAERYRAEYAEIADVAAQGARLGVSVDAADAMRKGIKPDALRRTVLDTLAERSAAADVIAAAPAAPGKPGAESPIVKRARERAAARS